MRSLCFVLLTAASLAVMSGCCCHRGCCGHGCGLFGCGPLRGVQGQCSDCPDTCQSCDSCAGAGCRGCASAPIDAGPASAAVAYPYYTTRGPRDFLARNPRNIGP